MCSSFEAGPYEGLLYVELLLCKNSSIRPVRQDANAVNVTVEKVENLETLNFAEREQFLRNMNVVPPVPINSNFQEERNAKYRARRSRASRFTFIGTKEEEKGFKSCGTDNFPPTG